MLKDVNITKDSCDMHRAMFNVEYYYPFSSIRWISKFSLLTGFTVRPLLVVGNWELLVTGVVVFSFITLCETTLFVVVGSSGGAALVTFRVSVLAFDASSSLCGGGGCVGGTFEIG